MKKFFFPVFFLLVCIQDIKADTNVYSEISHTIGGALLAGTISWASDRYLPEYDRAWMGFGVSCVIGIASQYYEYNQGSNTADEAAVDAVTHVLGSAIGAYVSDRYLLRPVLKKVVARHYYMGIELDIPL